MRSSYRIPGITVQICGDAFPYLYWESESPMRSLSSSIWGGGVGEKKYIVNRQVTKGYNCDEPLEEMAVFFEHEGINGTQAAGFLTAARVKDFGFASLVWPPEALERGLEPELAVSAWATAGFSNKARAGLRVPEEVLFPGTINIVVIVDAQIGDAVLAGAFITATEAKTAALQDLGITVEGGLSATGTTTDAVPCCSNRKGPILYLYGNVYPARSFNRTGRL
ncbi:adenosylcobinamide amidohydrolase [Paenibacillus larvae]|uniref:Adenosylcobinamide amidohydrolase n=2 Tax=Paenibacillus larvae TaxID=1464 RepID=V9W9Z9_9BACL|nr:adenosylcobinamide amidohydrolase [Paenibacillus larvae]AHD07003.1 hypothetical protein ERIC2_c32630 [Paenibacillus larvae subsp. larvae DSM 25430]AVG13567.1 Adenosylcobinamide amidohydrolase [Paenibacillus larvae subsp. larvae DSM 25430]MDR5568465.1 adenosylcobinamide amidohydrolase [Paenibacillus larvae]MDR5597252.1 adenosylcobinamide amidohydrolase [Paenibacillus larvae]